ncbi:LytR/AlgR family response regulator transcription factor [Polaribacter ponticola]|uniref:LytTR family DNA-binding domain-containing protein n=1 Tax=Polaribacter ponticola TaxID=2978475 RepID=A0ABT5S9I7_9FLAO|nr:LytTR family DNA-binding domain-containing protein [Polaribacter sp. MSW5]MDD7914146.1 LytTR family DNA-binding domain-containing protein [Polaribacter sp. MSW5]
MDCIIVDDEITARIIIRKIIEDVNDLNIVGDFSNAMQAIKFLNKNKVDVIFLDIHMPDFTGFDFIDSLKEPPKIVLTTSDRNFAVEAFEYKFVVDYLVKPLELDRFEKAIDKVKSFALTSDSTSQQKPNVEQSKDSFYVNIDRRLVKIDIPSIYVVEARGDYVKIKTDDKNHVVHCPLKKIEEKLPTDTFLKVHRSYIINLNKIVDIEDNSILIKQDVIPVSRSNRNELKRRLDLL